LESRAAFYHDTKSFASKTLTMAQNGAFSTLKEGTVLTTTGAIPPRLHVPRFGLLFLAGAWPQLSAV
jgi:hypothetical protein